MKNSNYSGLNYRNVYYGFCEMLQSCGWSDLSIILAWNRYSNIIGFHRAGPSPEARQISRFIREIPEKYITYVNTVGKRNGDYS